MYIPESVKVRVRHDSQYDNATTSAYAHNRNKDRDLNKESVDTKINWNTFPKVIK